MVKYHDIIRLACGLLAMVGLSAGQGIAARHSEAEEKMVPPRVAMCIPLGVAGSGTTKVVVRGWALNAAKEVRSSSPRVTFHVLSLASATVPNGQDAQQIGDTQIELEVTVMENTEPGEVTLTIVSPAGESETHPLLIGSVHPLISKTEPNDGFRQAQPVQIPQVVDGQIQNDRNVDVFSFELADPQQITIDVSARRFGSGLDSLLTLFDERGQIVAVSDDQQGTTDSRVQAQLPAGKYFISLQDAHDHGGPAHPYRLLLQRTP